MVEVEIAGKIWKVRELLAIENDEIDYEDKKTALKKQVMISTGMSDEDYSKLTIRERLKIIQAINQVNGFNDFQEPTKIQTG